MKTTIIDSPASLAHRLPEGHPEHAGRYTAVREALQGIAGTQWIEAPQAPVEALARFHSVQHVDRVLTACAEAGLDGWTALDPDTLVCGQSASAALSAAGGAIEGVDRVIGEGEGAVFLLARPPGHHAEPDRPMGFCLFNSVAVAAAHALDVHGLASSPSSISTCTTATDRNAWRNGMRASPSPRCTSRRSIRVRDNAVRPVSTGMS